jgi:hypothetical protein
MTTTAQPSAKRINRGRGHSYELDGRKVPGITTILGGGIPKPALVNWAAKESAQYVLDRWDELVALQPSQRYDAVLGARFESQRSAAVRGTDVHALAERHLAGEEIEVPEHLVGHVDAYEAFLADWEPAELFVERPVFSRRWQYAGTPDLCATLNDGKVWLLDWKTSGKGIFPENALQLAAARYAEFVLADDGREVPVPAIDRCGCVWLRADGYDLVPVEAGDDVFRYFLWAKRIYEFTNEPSGTWVGEAVQPRRA